MAEALFYEFRMVISNLVSYKAKMDEMLALPYERFGVSELIITTSVFSRGPHIGTLALDERLPITMDNRQLNILKDLVNKIGICERAIGVTEVMLQSKVNAFVNNN